MYYARNIIRKPISANAAPTKDFVLVCAGVASNCQGAQARLSYNNDRFGVTLVLGSLHN